MKVDVLINKVIKIFEVKVDVLIKENIRSFHFKIYFCELKGAINGICSQFCPATPRGCLQFHGARPALSGAGQGRLFSRWVRRGGAGRGSQAGG